MYKALKCSTIRTIWNRNAITLNCSACKQPELQYKGWFYACRLSTFYILFSRAKKQQHNLVRATRGYSPIPLLGEQLYQIWPFSWFGVFWGEKIKNELSKFTILEQKFYAFAHENHLLAKLKLPNVHI